MENKSFTRIELLVVIAIIGLLATVVMVSVGSVREKTKIAAAQAEIDEIIKAMITYRLDNGELPPIGDVCTDCPNANLNDRNPPNASAWDTVADALISGGYINEGMRRDPWGNGYAYDDNDENLSGGSPSRSQCFQSTYICTAGPNKKMEPGDFPMNWDCLWGTWCHPRVGGGDDYCKIIFPACGRLDESLCNCLSCEEGTHACLE